MSEGCSLHGKWFAGRKGDRSFLPHQGGCRLGPAVQRSEDKVAGVTEDEKSEQGNKDC